MSTEESGALPGRDRRRRAIYGKRRQERLGRTRGAPREARSFTTRAWERPRQISVTYPNAHAPQTQLAWTA